jgi:hypothetical protein
MDRMAEKHAREVKIVLDKDRVERGGELRQQIGKDGKASHGGAWESTEGAEGLTRTR